MPDVQFFESLIQNVGFVLMATDRTLTIRCWNEQASRVFGASSAERVGTPLLDVFPAEARERVSGPVSDALDRGVVSDVEFEHGGTTAERRTWVAIISPITAEDGARLGVSVAMRDITQRKRLSRQLGTARQMAALGNMSAGVAHHFNNILGGMLTSIDAALQTDNPRTIRRTLERVAESAGRAVRITQQLLAFAESEHRAGEIVDLTQAVRNFVESIRPSVDQHGLTLEVQIAPLPALPLESYRILTVLESVTQNSIDAMKAGGRLTLRLLQRGDEAVVRIEDTGAGIAPEVLSRIFEPFFTTKGELGGGSSDNVGLGLSVVHGLVKEMGGNIEIESQLGAGTQVEIRLPLRGANAEKR